MKVDGVVVLARREMWMLWLVHIALVYVYIGRAKRLVVVVSGGVGGGKGCQTSRLPSQPSH